MQDTVSLGSFVAAFGAGLISVLSPCVLPLMPAYLSLLSGVSVDALRAGGPRAERSRVLRGCAGFVAGFSAVFIALGASATALGRILRGFRLELGGFSVSLAQLAGVAIIAMGLHLTGLLPLKALYRDTRFGERLTPKGALGTFAVGAAFAFGWTPCIGPILGGILTLAGSRETVSAGMGLLAIYSLGLAVPFAAAALSLDWFFRTFGRIRAHFRAVEVGSGAILIVLGVLVATDRLTVFNTYLAFLNDWVRAAEGWLR